MAVLAGPYFPPNPLTDRDRKKFLGVLDEVIGFPYTSEMFSRERYDKQNNYVLFSELLMG